MTVESGTRTRTGRSGATAGWSDDLPAQGTRTFRRGVGVEDLVRAGVPVEAIEQYRLALMREHRIELTPVFAAGLLNGDLRSLAEFSAHMSLAAAIGWVLTCRTSLGLPIGGGPSAQARAHGRAWDVAVRNEARAWVQAGLGEDGWLFAAAGISSAEAHDQVASGSVDRGALEALAVLRGTTLPGPG